MKKIYKELRALQKLINQFLNNDSLYPAFKITLLQLNKDIKAALSFWKNKKISIGDRLPAKSDKLQIGGGDLYLEGFVNLDLFKPADIVWDCRYGLPFNDEQFNFVFSEHFLEHIDFPSSVKKVLSEIYRTLKVGGELLIAVPDCGKILDAYSKNDKKYLNKIKKLYTKRNPKVEIYGKIDYVNYLFRDQLDNQNYTIHYWGYDEESLTNLLLSLGFKTVFNWKFESKYCNPERKFYTLYIKAVK